MIIIIKKIKVYSPEYLGEKDVVIVGEKFEGIYDNVDIPDTFINLDVIDGKGKIIFPGFIDGHVHITGGGGEKGFSSRTPEIRVRDLITAGITTVVGCLGTDNVCRDICGLVAKCKALKEVGINSYCYTGSYEIPIKTLTSSIKKDIMMIEEVLGVGEVALSDNRSSQPTYDQFVNTVAQARVGGLLSGKSGIVNVHLGGGKKNLEYLSELINETEIPANQLLPTHINRNEELFMKGLEYVSLGGYIDLTTSSDPKHLEPGELLASEGLKRYLENGLPIEHITFSSDGNGSMPIFDDEGNTVGIGICSVKSLFGEVRKAILELNIPIETAIKVITVNIAKMLSLKYRGEIKENFSADFVIVDDKNLEIVDVYSRGKALFRDGKLLIREDF